MNNEHGHIFDDCIGNPPFAEALKTLGVGGGEKLTDAQQRFFGENKARVSNLPEYATDREKEIAKTAKLFIGYAENLQKKLNRMKDERTAAIERKQRRSELSMAWGVMTACYRAIDRHFGDQIRAQLAYNDETANQGKIRKLTAELERIAKK